MVRILLLVVVVFSGVVVASQPDGYPASLTIPAAHSFTGSDIVLNWADDVSGGDGFGGYQWQTPDPSGEYGAVSMLIANSDTLNDSNVAGSGGFIGNWGFYVTAPETGPGTSGTGGSYVGNNDTLEGTFDGDPSTGLTNPVIGGPVNGQYYDGADSAFSDASAAMSSFGGTTLGGPSLSGPLAAVPMAALVDVAGGAAAGVSASAVALAVIVGIGISLLILSVVWRWVQRQCEFPMRGGVWEYPGRDEVEAGRRR